MDDIEQSRLTYWSRKGRRKGEALAARAFFLHVGSKIGAVLTIASLTTVHSMRFKLKSQAKNIETTGYQVSISFTVEKPWEWLYRAGE